MTVSDNALLQFRPCHVYLPSCREYYLIFRALRDLEWVPLRIICTKLARSKPKSIRNDSPYKFREQSGWLIFGLWMGVNIVNVYIHMCSLEGLFITLFFLLSPWHQWDVMQRQGCNHCALKKGGGQRRRCSHSIRTGDSCRNRFRLWTFVSIGASPLTTLRTTQQLSWCSSRVDVCLMAPLSALHALESLTHLRV